MMEHMAFDLGETQEPESPPESPEPIDAEPESPEQVGLAVEVRIFPFEGGFRVTLLQYSSPVHTRKGLLSQHVADGELLRYFITENSKR